MELAAILALDVLNGVASLILLCTGLAIIFGMMRIINLAHGEFLMLGAYATVVSTNAGVNIWVAMLVVAPLFVGAVSLVVERCLIRFLYGRLVDTMLATWGLSLFIVGLVTTIYGNTIQGVPTPLGGFSIGAYRSSLYTLFLVAMAALLLAAVWTVLRYTRLGLIARATMQNPNMAAAEAALRQAQTAFDQAKQEYDRAKVTTKVAGIVQDPLATVGSMLSPGTPCATVVELDPMKFITNVPESRIARAELGLPAKVTTITGETIEGKVSFIASLADAATRSFPIEIELPNKDGKVLSGITATAVVNLGTVPAHLLPQSVLTLDDEGALGVRAVKDGVVEFYPVTIISDSRAGVWVTGLPATVDVITIGQEFVVPGQKVQATNVTGTPESSESKAAAEGMQS